MSDRIIRTVTCDRCGAQEVIEIDEKTLGLTPSREMVNTLYAPPFGWDRTARGMLCPRCYSEFLDLRKQFVNRFFGDSDE